MQMYITMVQCAKHENHNSELPGFLSYGPLNIVDSDPSHVSFL